MKRAIQLLTLLLSCQLASSWAQERQVQPVKLEKLSECLYATAGGRGARGGVYIGDDAVVVIDAKMDEATVGEVMKQIETVTDRPIKYLINTHSDGDHVLGNPFFPRGVTIVAHENCRKELFHTKRDGSPSEWLDPKMAPFVPSVTYKEKMDIYLGTQKVELWYFGVGHTTGDTVVYVPEEKVAFLGDQVFFGRPQLIHAYKGGNSFEHVKTLTRMLDTVAAERFCSGHGECTSREAVQEHIAQMRRRQQKVEALASAGNTLEEVKAQFSEEEARLIEVIYNEVKEHRTGT